MTSRFHGLGLRAALLVVLLPGVVAAGVLAGLSVAPESAALATVALATAAALTLATLLAHLLAARIAADLARLGHDALLAAAGDQVRPPGLPHSMALRGVAEAINRSAEDTELELAALARANAALECRARDRELLDFLVRDRPSRRSESLHVEWLGGNSRVADASGYVVAADGAHLLAWIAEGPDPDLLAALHLRGQIETTCTRILERYPTSPREALATLRSLHPDRIRAFLSLDASARCLQAVVHRPIAMLLARGGELPAVTELAHDRTIEIPATGFAVLSSTDPIFSLSAPPGFRVGAGVPPAAGGEEPLTEGLVIGLYPAVPLAVSYPLDAR